MPERERPRTEGVRMFGAEPVRGARPGSGGAGGARPADPGNERTTLWEDADDDDQDGLTVLDEDDDEDDWDDDEGDWDDDDEDDDLEDDEDDDEEDDDLEDDEDEDDEEDEEDEDEAWEDDEDEDLEDDEDEEDDDDLENDEDEDEDDDEWDDDWDDEDDEDDDEASTPGVTAWDDDEWGEDAGRADDAPIVVSTGEVELPHWTEPATGQVPAVLAEAVGEDDDDFAAWNAVAGQPRFRSDASDWDATDWQQGDLPDEADDRVGALADEVDDDAEFEAQVRARRAGTRRVVSSTPAARGAVTPEDEPPLAPPRVARSARSGADAGDDTGSDTTGGNGGRGRDLPAAVITAVVLAGIAVVCLVGGPVPTTGLAALVGAVCAYEFVQGLRTKPAFKPAVPLVVTACALMPVAAYNFGPDAFMVVGSVTTVATILWYMMKVGPGRPVAGVASSMLVFGYVGVFVGFVGLILAAPRNDGIGILLGAVLCTITYDVVGYFSGTKFGRSKVAPTVSPNKSVEGTVAGMVAVVVVAMFVVGQIGPWDIKTAFVLGVAVAVAAFVGDLAESMFKRDLDLKDFGALLPGHGGFFDRFDGLIFAMPVVYFLARIFDFFT